MESVQCLESMPSVLITQSRCLPSMEEVKQYLLALTRKISIYSVFVASNVPAENHGHQQRLEGRVSSGSAGEWGGRRRRGYFVGQNILLLIDPCLCCVCVCVCVCGKGGNPTIMKCSTY